MNANKLNVLVICVIFSMVHSSLVFAHSPVSLDFERDFNIQCCPVVKCPLVSLHIDLLKTFDRDSVAKVDRDPTGLVVSLTSLRSEAVLSEGIRGNDIQTNAGDSASFENFENKVTLVVDQSREIRDVDLEVTLTADKKLSFGTSPRTIVKRTATDRVGVGGAVDVYGFTAELTESSVVALKSLQPKESGKLFPGQRQVLDDKNASDRVFNCVLKIPQEILRASN